jgi:hypothetical protein
MALTFNAQGLPPLLNKINTAIDVAGLLVADGFLVAQMFSKVVKWGVYPAGFVSSGVLDTRALIPDSIVSFGYKKEWNVPKYPMELGAFQSYNKVTEPYDIRIRMSISNNSTTFGISSSLKAIAGAVQTTTIDTFLAQLATMAASLDLYDVVTPDATYLNANITHYDYNRTATNGVGLLTVDVYLTEIRNTIAPAFANVVAPTSSAAGTSVTNPVPTADPVPPGL